LNYCRTKVPMGVIEAVNGNIKALLRRGRGYRDVNYLLLKAQRLAATFEGENWGSRKRNAQTNDYAHVSHRDCQTYHKWPKISVTLCLHG